MKAYNLIVERYSPPALVINTRRELLWYVGDVSVYLKYLHQTSGPFSSDVVRLVADELSMPFATAIYKVTRDKGDVSYNGLTVKTGDTVQQLRLYCAWVEGSDAEHHQIVICFENTVAINSDETSRGLLDIEVETAQRISHLEQNLAHTQENLQATIEELETSNEELQSSNEELMAANEELQSTNEELHSVNEELHTVNAEYQGKIQELTELHADIDNLLRSTNIGTVFLDRDLRVRKFTPAITSFIPLVEHDIGRPINHFCHAFTDFDLVHDMSEVLHTASGLEREQLTQAGTWTLLRILPFVREGQTCEGVVLSCLDITARKHTEVALAEHARQMEAVRATAFEMTQELDLANLLSLMLERALDLIDAASGGVVFLWDDDTEKLTPKAWHNVESWLQDMPFKLGEELNSTPTDRLDNPLRADNPPLLYVSPILMQNLGSAAVEPLVYRDKLIGVIELIAEQEKGASTTGGRFSLEDQTLLRLFARHAAISIVNAKLFEEAHSQNDQLIRANEALHQEITERIRTESS